MIGLALSKHSKYFQTLEVIAICTVFYECYCESEKVKVKVTQWCPTLWPRGLYSQWNSPGQNTGVGSHSLLQGMFPTQGLKPRSPALQADSLPAEPPGKPKNTVVGSLSLLQGIFPTQESNLGLLHCRQILYQLSLREADVFRYPETKIRHTQDRMNS